MIAITAVNPRAYRKPRNSAMKISPIATSSGPIEVASIPWYSLANFSLKKTFQVES